MARPRRKAADSQEIRQILEDSGKKEADLSGLSGDSAEVKTFQLMAGRDAEIPSSSSKAADQFRKIKWYVGYVIKYFLGS